MDENESIAQVTDDPFASVRVPEYKNLILGRFFFHHGTPHDGYAGWLVDL